jgi:Secretion system C-terminal sorting domain
MKGILTIIACLFVLLSLAQIERQGEPLTWQLTMDHENGSIWQVLPSLNVEELLAEDELELNDKSTPLRFAKRIPVQIDLSSDGRWSNLHNGDRIWLCGIEIDEAKSIGLSFANLNIPEGGSLFLYSSDRSDFIGPLTLENNSTDQSFIIPPVLGDKVIIEYYEPYVFRGQGELNIEAATAGYRDVHSAASIQDLNCWEQLTIAVNNTQQMNASSAVLLTIVDDGQRIGTSVLLNNTSSNGIPYLMTASSMLMGNPSRWLFLFDVVGSGCFNAGVNCWSKAICGGVVSESHLESGTALIRLREMPRQNWSAYYSGWQTNEMTNDHRFFLIQQANGLPQSVAEYNGELEFTTWNGFQVGTIQHWDEGSTFKGSIGSPLFDEDLNLIGILIGGDLNCDGQGVDYFAMLNDSWDTYKDYLDPFVTGQSRFEGEFPVLQTAESQNNEQSFIVFPNPAQNWIYVRNQTNEPIEYIEFADGTGRVIHGLKPLTPSLDISSLPEGIYFVWIVTRSQRYVHRLLVR